MVMYTALHRSCVPHNMDRYGARLCAERCRGSVPPGCSPFLCASLLCVASSFINVLEECGLLAESDTAPLHADRLLFVSTPGPGIHSRLCPVIVVWDHVKSTPPPCVCFNGTCPAHLVSLTKCLALRLRLWFSMSECGVTAAVSGKSRDGLSALATAM